LIVAGSPPPVALTDEASEQRVAVRNAVKREKKRPDGRSSSRKSLKNMVEPNGIEPSTS
jgi:hypothetical protein